MISSLRRLFVLTIVAMLGILVLASVANAAPNEWTGTQGNDVRVGSLKPDFMVGLDGNDQLYGCGLHKKGDNSVYSCEPKDLGDKDKLFGNGGRDLLMGGGGRDFLSGGPGDDSGLSSSLTGLAAGLIGGRGNDRLSGGPGDDNIKGGPGRDRLLGGFGDDVFRDSEGANNIFCGGGHDTVFANRKTKTHNCEAIR